ncbi:MAG: hypothetical protein SYC29_13900 [Planctomycetota bacterium]|nr:hypothetical protein [Planctomycetota bacterium]
MTFWTKPIPAPQLSTWLCEVAAFLQQLDPHAAMKRYDDWLEHDGLHFDRGAITFPELFSAIGSPRDLLAATPDDDRVCVGVADERGRWYLRFRLEWDDDGRELTGFFDVTLRHELADRFRTELDTRSLIVEPSAAYFARIQV